MKKALIIVLFSSLNMLYAKEVTSQTQEVIINNNIQTLIRSFIEYEIGCHPEVEYPENSTLYFHSIPQQALHWFSLPQEVLSDTISNVPVITFSQDEFSWYKHIDYNYISLITVNNKCYKIYIIIDDTWNESDILYFFHPTSNYITTIKSDESFPLEYDPSYIRFWCGKGLNNIYIEWEATNYCW